MSDYDDYYDDDDYGDYSDDGGSYGDDEGDYGDDCNYGDDCSHGVQNDNDQENGEYSKAATCYGYSGYAGATGHDEKVDLHGDDYEGKYFKKKFIIENEIWHGRI